jgi:hypothetical protein
VVIVLGIPGDRILKLHENSESWHLVFDDARVQMIQIDFRLGLLIADKSGTAQIYIESPFSMRLSCREWVRIFPERPETLSPILSLVNKPVLEAQAENDGTLTLKFDGDHKICIVSDQQYEAWQLSCGSKTLVGGLNIK